MSERSFLSPRLIALAAAAALSVGGTAAADPLDVDTDNIGPRYLGVQYIDNLGWAAASPGDLNGDGLSDFAVSSPQDDGPLTFSSVLRLYFGSADGAPGSSDAGWSSVDVSDGKIGTDAVYQFAFIPDATGDGVGDLLVAEPTAAEAGKVLLYALPGPGVWPEAMGAPDAVARWDGYLQDELATVSPETRPSLVGGGDFDGDGLADIVIVSGLFNRIWIDYSDEAFDGTTVLDELADIIVRCDGEIPAARFGASIAIGNFNNDTRADLAVAAPGCEDDAGRVFVWLGTAAGLADEPDTIISNGDRLGGALNVADLNQDGFDDLFVQELLSAVDGDASREGRGNLWIHFGGANGIDLVPDGKILGGFSDKRFGETLALMPDTSNPPDGLPELAVGAPESAIGGVGQGAVYLFDGRDDWAVEMNANEAHYRVVGSQRDAWFGASLAAVDDFDGDGNPELVIGEPNFTDGNSENDFQRGRFYLFNALPDRDADDDGISTLNGDCDDTNADVNPATFEDCDDDIDNNCNHVINEGCGDDDDATDDDDDATPPPDDDDGDDGCDGCSSNAVAETGTGTEWGLALFVVVALRRYRRRTE